jgi:hypothetical protein
MPQTEGGIVPAYGSQLRPQTRLMRVFDRWLRGEKFQGVRFHIANGRVVEAFRKEFFRSPLFLGDFEKPELYYLKIFARCRRSRRFEMSMLL